MLSWLKKHTLYSSNSKKLLVSEQIVGYKIANNEY